MKRTGGFTIIQTMIIILVVGIIGSIAVKFVIDKRCEEDASRTICAERKSAG